MLKTYCARLFNKIKIDRNTYYIYVLFIPEIFASGTYVRHLPFLLLNRIGRSENCLNKKSWTIERITHVFRVVPVCIKTMYFYKIIV